MPSSIGPVGLLLIVVVALILFGPKKLPELGRAFGRTLREFKEGAKELMKEEEKTNVPPGEGSTGTTVSSSTTPQRMERRLPD